MINELGFCTNCGHESKDTPELAPCPVCKHEQSESLGEPITDGIDPSTAEIPFS